MEGQNQPDLTRLEAEIDAFAAQYGPKAPALAMLLVRLEQAGFKVRPPRWAGDRTYITFPDGTQTSLAGYLALVRLHQLNNAACDYCGQPIPADSYVRRLRGMRVNRRYCSNAHRQAAYRQRSRGVSAKGERLRTET